MQYTVRKAQPDDAEQLITYIEQLLREPDIPIPLHPDEFAMTVEQERQSLVDALDSDRSVFLVAEANGRLIGEINCRSGVRRAFGHAVSLGMSVSLEWRKKGVGSRLMTEAIAWAKTTAAVTRVELFVYASNAAAIHLYEKFGFEVEGRRRQAVRHNGRFVDDLIMARLL